MSPTKLAKGHRITGAERAQVSKRIVALYVTGSPIRAIADHTGRSYGFVHRILGEAGVDLRPRGGSRPLGR